MTDHKTSTAQTGGQWNFAGILYQLLVTLRAGADAAISEVREGNDVLGVRVIVEPHMGGDSQTLTTVRRLVDQIKIRRGQKPWTARGIIENVLSDLFKARDPAGMPTSFRFVTDNLEGTDKLGAFLGEVHTAQKNGQGPETLDSSARSFRWGNERIAAATLFERTAAQLSPRDSREVWEFLGAVEIVGWSEIVSLGTVDALIGEMVDDRADVRGKRQALCTALLQLGTAGESIDLRALFAGVGLDPDKLTYARDLPAALLAQVREEASFRKYDRAMDVRSAPTLPLVPFSLLSGDSGQGKTWRLCQAALNLGEQGRCAILLPATGTIREIEDGIVALVWRDRFGGTASLGRISELLRPKLADEAGVWLTVYLDDLADAGLANAVARMPWARWGVRVVVTAQKSPLERELPNSRSHLARNRGAIVPMWGRSLAIQGVSPASLDGAIA